MITLGQRGDGHADAYGRCSDCRRRCGRLLRRAQPAEARHQAPHRLQGPRRQKRRVAVRRQPGDLRPAARQHRGAGAQHRRIPDQVPQPVSHRSGMGAPVRRLDRAGLLPRAGRARSLLQARRRRKCRHQPGHDPQHRRQRAGKFRRAVHGSAAQAGHQGRNPAPGGNGRDRAPAQQRRIMSAACSASTT